MINYCVGAITFQEAVQCHCPSSPKSHTLQKNNVLIINARYCVSTFNMCHATLSPLRSGHWSKLPFACHNNHRTHRVSNPCDQLVLILMQALYISAH